MIPWQIDWVDGQPTVHIEARSTPRWLLQRYLVKLGGRVEEEERRVVGEGWRAVIAPGEPVRRGSLAIGVNYLDLFGAEETLRDLMSTLGLWLLRGGG